MADSSHKKGRYTKYSNKIGLHSNSKGGFIKNDTDVVLSFPFKDTVLEAGMSKEDVGREERFLHIEVDSKDIDTLEEPKVLTDFKLVDKNGEKQLTANDDIEFFDEEGNLKQNLLIKGNNLLALHTLSTRLAGQVKLIYIDPPYNTGSDGFKYNDRFNHSSWLAFMKNRLEIAKELLSKDGTIFVQCDDNEQAYLTVLMDEIFGLDNRVNTIVIKMSEATGLKMSHVDSRLPKLKEYILFYRNQEVQIQSDKIKIAVGEIGINYNKLVYGLDEEELNYIKLLMSKDIVTDEEIEKADGFLKKMEIKPIQSDFPNWNNLTADEQQQIKRKNATHLVRDVASASAKKLADKKRTNFDQKFFLLKTSRSKAYLIKGDYSSDTKDPNIKLVFADSYLYSNPGDLWTDIKTTRVDREGSVQLLNGKKPERILERIIDMVTVEGDIVLDFCLGSGTTSAVAHKMSRKWIGIEQMDYIEKLAKTRLLNVILGDSTGVSEATDWQGGGSFVYFEMKKYNQEYVDRIMQATSLSELEEIYVEMRNNAFLKFWFDRKEFEKDENFRNLDIEKRKQKLVDVLDENQLYLNYADMHDTRHKVNEDEKVLTDKFYGTAEN